MLFWRGGDSGMITYDTGERERPLSLRSRYIVSEASWVIIIKIKFLSIFSAYHSQIHSFLLIHHLKSFLFFPCKYTTVSPKKELAHANQSLVIDWGESTEKDSCIKSFLADLIKLSKQLDISLSLSDVIIWVIRAKGHINLLFVCELPIPLILPEE